jgi:hypothetical protein
MKKFQLVDERGDEFTYDGTDMRAVLAVHFRLHQTEIVKAKLTKEGHASVEAEQISTELLAFVAYLKSRNLMICTFSKGTMGYWPPNCEQEDLVAAYMNVMHR